MQFRYLVWPKLMSTISKMREEKEKHPEKHFHMPTVL